MTTDEGSSPKLTLSKGLSRGYIKKLAACGILTGPLQSTKWWLRVYSDYHSAR